MARTSSYTYNPRTGTWSKTTSGSKDTGSTTTTSGSNNSGSTTTTKTGGSNNPSTSSSSSSSSSGNLTASTGDNKSSIGSTEQKYNYIEINTLVGQLAFIVTEETIKLTAGDTVKLEGLGKYLSGNYYVKEMNRNISSNGYSHNAIVIKTDFGTSLKSTTKTSKKTTKEPEKKVPSTKKKEEKKPQKPTLTDDIKKHVAAAIWNGNYGWYNEPTRVARLTEVFGANNGIQAIVNKGYNYIAGISPAGYSYEEMKRKFKG